MFSGLLKRAADTAKRAADTASNAASTAATAATSASLAAAKAAKRASDSLSDTATTVIASANLDRLQDRAATSPSDVDTALGAGAGAGAGAGDGAGGSEGTATATGAEHAVGMPRDVAPEFDGLDFTYITPKVIAMGPMVPRRMSTAAATAYTQLASRFLRERHGEHFVVVNISESRYDYSLFDNQVMEFSFPGHPAPPLGMLCKICTSMESWLNADPKNVVVVHCMTGRGRTVTLLSCYLAWVGEYVSPLEALMHVCERRGLAMEKVIVPSQSRYAYYFTTLMDGIKPRPAALVLRRVLINGVPDCSAGAPEESQAGCRPFLQVFQCGKVLYSSTWTSSRAAHGSAADGDSGDAADSFRFYQGEDGAIKFDVNATLHGDVLIRCRHKRRGGRKSLPIFRAAFHTGYTPELVLRFSKAQLDGVATTASSARGSRASPGAVAFPSGFFVELIFAPVTAASPLPASSASTAAAASDVAGVEGAIRISEADRPAYDAMLASQSHLWTQVARRKALRDAATRAGPRHTSLGASAAARAATTSGRERIGGAPSNGGASADDGTRSIPTMAAPTSGAHGGAGTSEASPGSATPATAFTFSIDVEAEADGAGEGHLGDRMVSRGSAGPVSVSVSSAVGSAPSAGVAGEPAATAAVAATALPAAASPAVPAGAPVVLETDELDDEMALLERELLGLDLDMDELEGSDGSGVDMDSAGVTSASAEMEEGVGGDVPDAGHADVEGADGTSAAAGAGVHATPAAAMISSADVDIALASAHGGIGGRDLPHLTGSGSHEAHIDTPSDIDLQLAASDVAHADDQEIADLERYLDTFDLGPVADASAEDSA